MLKIDDTLSEEQQSALREIPATSWFTAVEWQNAASPPHPFPGLDANNDLKLEMTRDWIAEAVPGKRVLDLFSANGGFSVTAALAGAKSVVGVEYDEQRVACAEFVASTVRTDCEIEFRVGDVYRLREYFSEPFDVVLCLGGLYHIADPAYLLKQMGELTTESMILQTTRVIDSEENTARFRIRRREDREGGTSIRRGNGVWQYSPACLRALLEHGGFEVLEERRPPKPKRRRFPWYLAHCRPA